MATVYQDLDPGAAQPPAANFAVFVKNAGTNFPVAALKFDADAEWSTFWRFTAINYGSGNVTVRVEWYADTASTGDVIWGCQLAAITTNTDTQDVETKAFATAGTATDTHLGTTGQRLHSQDVTVSNLDSLAARDAVWLRLYRDADAAGDTLTGAVFVTGVTVSYSDV